MTMRNRLNRISFWLLISVLSLPTVIIRGQEMLGASLGNYNALTGSLLNPAILTNTHDYLEINFGSGDLFVNNNAFYIPGSDLRIWDIWKDSTEFPVYGDKKSNFLIYNNRNLKYAVTNIRLLGPSAMFQYGKHAIALTTGVRFFTSASRIPYEIPVFGYESLKYKPLQNVNFNDHNLDAGSMAWMEVGLSYAYNLYSYGDEQLTVGASFRKLWAYAGVYGEASNANYVVLNDSTINVKNLNGKVGFAVPVDYDNNDFPVNDPFFKGSGFGFDVGVVYIKRRYVDRKRWERLCDQDDEEYNYRIGFSVIDIGRVKFKHNAQLHSFDDVSLFWQNFDTINYSNVNQVIREISNAFYGSPDSSFRGNSFKLGLPTAVSLQFDYRLKWVQNLYVAAVWINPLRFNLHTLRRPAQISIVPRYETKQLEFDLPIVLYEYKYPRIGFAARFSFVTIGTERLGTYLGLADLNGMDIYFSVKLNFGKGGCRRIRRVPVECLNQEYGYSDKDKAKFRKRSNKRYRP